MLSFLRLQQLLQGSSIRPEDAVQLGTETAEAIVLQAWITLPFTVCTIVETDGCVLVGRRFYLNSSVHVSYMLRTVEDVAFTNQHLKNDHQL